MSKTIKNKYVLKVWDGINIFFGIATLITLIAFAVLFVLCFTTPVKNDNYGTIIGMCGVFASLASAFFIALFVRFYDLKNKRIQEEKALNTLTPNLIGIYNVINEFLPQIKVFVKIKNDDTISYSREKVYYTDEDLKEGNRDFIDFTTAFASSKKKLDIALEKCLKSPLIFQCNGSVAGLLTRMQLNGFTHNLFEIQSTAKTLGPDNVVYGSLHSNFMELWELYVELVQLLGKRTNERLRKLTEEEKAIYIKEIETILPQLPPTGGNVYLGYKRIK